MAKNTSVTLGEHFEGFIATQIEKGRFNNSSEAVREGLRLLEERETKLEALRMMIDEGDASGVSDRTVKEIIQEAKQELEDEA